MIGTTIYGLAIFCIIALVYLTWAVKEALLELELDKTMVELDRKVAEIIEKDDFYQGLQDEDFKEWE
jgi:uncharacterized membrane protein YqjE